MGWRSEDVFTALHDHYNGYQFARSGVRTANVYNPYTLMSCLQEILDGHDEPAWAEGRWPRFWALSGTPGYLIRLVEQGKCDVQEELPAVKAPEAIDEVCYEWAHPNYADLMLQTGYYTYRGGYDGTPLHIDYPNREVRATYVQSLWRVYQGRQPLPNRSGLEWLRAPLQERQYRLFRQRLETFLAGIPGSLLRVERPYHLAMHVLGQAMKLEFGS